MATLCRPRTEKVPPQPDAVFGSAMWHSNVVGTRTPGNVSPCAAGRGRRGAPSGSEITVSPEVWR
ncbi:MAG: hypothetical protein D6725_02180 [Planctomycetota bacterium]|nr:MAG: hypothetical protein D6725_02180 [Planctomycetota bacterium]